MPVIFFDVNDVAEDRQSDSPVDGIVPQVGAEEIDCTLKEQGLERFHQGDFIPKDHFRM